MKANGGPYSCKQVRDVKVNDESEHNRVDVFCSDQFFLVRINLSREHLFTSCSRGDYTCMMMRKSKITIYVICIRSICLIHINGVIILSYYPQTRSIIKFQLAQKLHYLFMTSTICRDVLAVNSRIPLLSVASNSQCLIFTQLVPFNLLRRSSFPF